MEKRKQARISIDREVEVSRVDERIFSSFIEHLGRAVYEGIYQPGSKFADEDGLRTDTIDLIKELKVPYVRYPGGNFVSGFKWEDSVGPVSQRPHRIDPAWGVIETNEFGLHEFMNWAKKADVKPMYTINLGTRGVSEAKDVIEYCNIKSAEKTGLKSLLASNSGASAMRWTAPGRWGIRQRTSTEESPMKRAVC